MSPRRGAAARAGRVVLCAALSAAGPVFAACRRAPSLEEYGRVPDFTLTERSGRTVRLADLLGRPWVADFIFTRCTGICPAMTTRLARLDRELPEAVRAVSITVDPGHDTPAVLAEYGRRAGASPDWMFLTGPPAAVYDLSVKGFRLSAEALPPDQAGPDGPFLHSSKFVLVDARAVIRGYYDSADEAALRRLSADAETLLR
ncbi:MAG TPA: SCO family protein [Vicinamibacteria bacterium]|nr:SCO family protein [Vicinamibacteria bacterium]